MNRIAFLVGGIVLLTQSIDSAIAVSMKQQTPCTQDLAGACFTFTYTYTDPPSTLTIRSFKFTISGPSDVLVNFNGAMWCSSPFNGQVVDMLSQIVQSAGGLIKPNGPSSLRLVLSLPELNESGGVNLASSRVIHYASGGEKVVLFKLLAKSLVYTDFTCHVTNAAFNFVVTP